MAKTRSTKRKSSSRSKSVLNSTASFSTNPLVPEPTPSKPDVTALTAEAATLLHTANQPNEALSLITEALQAEPENLPALELLGEIHLELGDESMARSVFEKAASLDPEGTETGPEKFLWLAQLGEGGEKMMQWYEKGTEVLRRWIKDGKSSCERDLEGKLCSALCAMSEIYMSDLCDEPDAESRCESYVTEALLVSPSSAEAFQTLASVRISQQRLTDAVIALQRSFNLWSSLPADSTEIPTYASRINLAKLLIETQQYDTALEVLERLQLEDDQLPDLWYLGGWCLYLYGEQAAQGSDERKELWGGAREWLTNCEVLFQALGWEDQGIWEHAVEIRQKIVAEIGEESEGEDEDGEDGEEDGWESDEDVEME